MIVDYIADGIIESVEGNMDKNSIEQGDVEKNDNAKENSDSAEDKRMTENKNEKSGSK